MTTLVSLLFFVAQPITLHAQEQSFFPNDCEQLQGTENLNPSLTDALFNSVEGQTTAGSAEQAILNTVCKPQPRISIPGITFSSPYDVASSLELEQDGSVYINIPFLGEYIRGIYLYGLIALVVIAVIFIVIAGIQWMTPSADGAGKKAAQTRIFRAMMALILGFGSYAFLYSIDPNLVTFTNLRVKYIETVPISVPGGDGIAAEDIEEGKTEIPGFDTMTFSLLDQCIYQNFLLGKNAGDEPETGNVTLFNLGTYKVNAGAKQAWSQVSDAILASPDPEVQGYLKYMHAIYDYKVPDLLGGKDGKGTVQSLIGRIGISRATGEPTKYLLSDTHVLGLSLDIMTRSNWLVTTPLYSGAKHGYTTKKNCDAVSRTIDKMKNGDYDAAYAEYGITLSEDPFLLFDRVEKKLEQCYNGFEVNPNTGQSQPWTSFPDEWIRIFEQHGFYWGGDGWGNPFRADAMHFEYYGSCLPLRLQKDQETRKKYLQVCSNYLSTYSDAEFCGAVPQ